MLTSCRTVSDTTTATDIRGSIRTQWTPIPKMARSLSVDPVCETDTLDSQRYYPDFMSSICSCIGVTPSITTFTPTPIATTSTSGSASTTSNGKERNIRLSEPREECRDNCAEDVLQPLLHMRYLGLCSDIVATTIKFADKSYVLPQNISYLLLQN